VCLAARLCSVDGQVAARVAGSDDEYALALEVVGVAVAAGVQRVPLEASRIVGYERSQRCPLATITPSYAWRSPSEVVTSQPASPFASSGCADVTAVLNRMCDPRP
jgi:hypothetical protein